MNPMGRDLSLRMRAHVARASGAAPRSFVAGDVFLTADEIVVLPEERASDSKRNFHPSRYVVVLQSENASSHVNQKTVLVAPCSASHPPGPFDHEFDSENGFSERDVTVYTSLVQPLLKTDLVTHRGRLSEGGLRELQLRVAALFDFASAIDLGTRSEDAAVGAVE
jgi:mRNA-degrading endonuclease toxin of MazEF toxin-antitoxin module